MLSILRKKNVMKKILWGLAIIIIPAFVLWGAGSAIRSKVQGKSYVGTISGKKISFKKFADSQSGIKVYLLLTYFNQMPVLNNILKDRSLVNKAAWERLIILDDAERRNIKVSDAEVISFITSHPIFSSNGQFYKGVYTNILRDTLGMTERTFEEKVRESIKIIKLNNRIVEDVSVTDEEVRDAYKKEREKASASYVLVEKNKLKDGLDIANDDIELFYRENRDSFIVPETIDVEYLPFKFETPQEKDAAVNKLIDIFSKIQKDPGNLYGIINEEGLATEETGYFARGQVAPKIGWNPDFYNAAFRLGKGQIAEPVIPEEEKGACFILWVKEIRPGRAKTLEETRDAIASALKEEKAFSLAKEKAEAIYKNAVSDKSTLEEIAGRNALELKNTGLVSRFEYIEGIGESYFVVEGAFNTKKGDLSEPLPSRAGFVILRPEEFLFIDEEKFDKEKGDYRDKVLAAKKTRALDEWFNGISKNTGLVIDLGRL